MPTLSVCNNFGHHVRVKITKDHVLFDQNKEDVQVGAMGNFGLPAAGAFVGAGGMTSRSEERNHIHSVHLEDPSWCIIDAGRKTKMSYFKQDRSYLTLDIYKDKQYVRKLDVVPLSEDRNSAYSVTVNGAVESTKLLEKIGIGRKHHNKHDPTILDHMKKL